MSAAKKKVLIIDKQYFRGGGETYKLDIYRALGTEKYEFTFSTPHEGAFSKVVQDLGCKYIPFTPKSRLDIIGMIKYAYSLKKYSYNVVITSDSDSWYTGVFLKLINRPELLLAVIHISTRGMGKKFGIVKNTVIKIIDRIWTCFYNFIISSTEYHADILKDEGVNPSKIVIIKNSVDQEKICSKISESERDRWKERLSIPEGAVILGMFGRFGAGKDYRNIINAIPLVLKEQKNCIFILAGDGPDLESMKALASQTGVMDYVRFPGFIERDYYTVMSLIEIFVNSTIAEGISYVVLDAMALGIPIVATRSGGIGGAVRHGENGVLVNPEDPTALAEGIIRILCDKENRIKMSENARKIQNAEFSLEKMASQFRELVELHIKC